MTVVEEEEAVSEAVMQVSADRFDAEVLGAEVPVVVDFWAPWCGPCRAVAPELEKLAARVGDSAKIVKVNVDESRDIAMRYGVMSIPTIVLFDRGTLVSQIIGARSADAMAREFGLA